MQYIECPSEDAPDYYSIFLAGGITDCPDWQREILTYFESERVSILNPRRVDFPMGDPSASEAQIVWEHKYLRLADAIVFWFPKTSVCPISLYELGTWTQRSMSGSVKVAIGIEPGYPREVDVRVQTELANPKIPIVDCLKGLALAVL